jgi:hypothetical protein
LYVLNLFSSRISFFTRMPFGELSFPWVKVDFGSMQRVLHSKQEVYSSGSPARPERFGSASSPLGMPGGISGFLPMLEQRPLAGLVVKDVAAFNAPKVTLARSWKERLDTATLEFANTGITLLSSLFLPRLLRHPVSKISGIPVEALKREIPYTMQGQTSQAVKLARLGTSFAFFFPFAAAFWAAPFFRNWLTLKRTNSASFEAMIGFDELKNSAPQRSPQAEMAYQKKKGRQVFGVGLALGLASLLGFSAAARGIAGQNGKNLWTCLESRLETDWKKNWSWLFEKFDLKGKGAYQIAGGPATLFFWGMPAYLGWIHAARSRNEKRERLLQSANALFWFFFAPVLTGWLWHKPFLKVAGKPELWSREFLQAIRENMHPNEVFAEKFKGKIANLQYAEVEKHFRGTPEQKRNLIRLKNWKFAVSDLAIPIGTLSLVQLINFRLTERKIKRQMQQAASAGPLPSPQPVLFQQAGTTGLPSSAPMGQGPPVFSPFQAGTPPATSF